MPAFGDIVQKNSIKCAKILILEEYSDQEIVNAIYLAEGGKSAQYQYGIRSIKCESKKDCRRICLRTVKENRKRFENYVRNRSEDYISYLGRIYSPLQARNDPKGLNRNWIKNVRFYLMKGGDNNGKTEESCKEKRNEIR